MLRVLLRGGRLDDHAHGEDCEHDPDDRIDDESGAQNGLVEAFPGHVALFGRFRSEPCRVGAPCDLERSE